MAGAGDFGAKSSSIINYIYYKNFPNLTIMDIKKLQYKNCNYENINKLFYQKNNFDNDFISISNGFASLQTVCY